MNIKYVYIYTKNIFNIKVDYTCHFYWVTSKLDYFYPKKYYIGIKKKHYVKTKQPIHYLLHSKSKF